MLFSDLIKTSTIALKRNASRSILTILGIVIGIASVILMLSIGKSAEGLILSQVADLGSDLIFIEPSAGDPQKGPPNPFVEQTLDLDDINILRNSDYFSSVSATVMTSLPITHNQESQFLQIAGVDEYYLDIFPTDLKSGRFFDKSDIDSYSKVAVLGIEAADDLFGDQSPIGQKIKIGDVTMRIIGVFDEQGTRFFQNLDTQIAIPVTTAQRDVLGVDYVNYITMIADGDIAIAKDEARWIMRDAHNLNNFNGDVELDDFIVSSQSDAVEIISVVSGVLTILLSSIAAISLLVGGIGIMNIMLVSVTERTKEIGLRKSLGATRKEILQQFLVESVILTFAGGVIGVVLGIIGSIVVGAVAGYFVDGWGIFIPLSGIIAGVIVATVVGIVFGVYPARHAAELDPIEALRYE